jgi:WD40 repeat protein
MNRADEPAFLFDAFISYRRSDGTVLANSLRQRLVQYRAPEALRAQSGTKLRVFVDTMYERATDDFFEKNIKPNLRRSRYLILFCTPAAFTPRPDGSPSWVERELLYFMSLPQGANLMPVLAGAQEQLPENLARQYPNMQFIDLRDSTRGAWWRVGRRQHDDDESLKIIATLLQVPDEQMPVLRREESLRRQRRRRVFASIGVAVLALVSGLALWAVQSLITATQQLVSNHTLQGQRLFDENPAEARLHFARAVKTADSFLLRRIGIRIEERDARLWLGQYPAVSPPHILWHAAAVTAAAISHDERLLAVGTIAGDLTVWDTKTWQQVGTSMHHGGQIECVRFSPDGTRLASGSRGNDARVWDLKTGKLVGMPIVHDDYVMWVAFDPPGKQLGSVGADGSAWITTLEGGARLVLTGHSSSNHRIEFSADGARVLTSSSDGTARLWNATTGAPIATLAKGQSYAVGFSADGHFILTSGAPRVWNGETGEALGASVPHERVVMASFARQADRFATASWDKTARVWDRKTGAQIGKSMQHPVPVQLLAWSEDGRLLATSDARRTVRVWNAEQGEQLGAPVQHNDEVVYVAFLHNRQLITASSDRTTRVTDIRGIDSDPWIVPEAAVASFMPDGKSLVTASKAGAIKVWDIASRTVSGSEMSQDTGVSRLAISADGARLAALSGNLTTMEQWWSIALWDLTTRRRIGGMIKPGKGVSDASFSPDHARMLLRGMENEFYLVSGDTGAPLGAPLHLDGHLSRGLFSPDGQMIATSGAGVIQLWDRDGHALEGATLNHPSSVLDLSFSDDGKYLVSGTLAYDSSARVWDLKTRTLAGPVQTHVGGVRSVRFDPASRHVVSSSDDGTAHVWEFRTGLSLGRPLQHAKGVLWAEFSPDGHLVVTGSSDGTARVWSSETGEPVSRVLEHGARPVEDVSNSSLGVIEARFNRDGGEVLTLGADESVRLWKLRPISESWQVASLRAEVETGRVLDETTGATRNLTETEWRERRARLEQQLQ